MPLTDAAVSNFNEYGGSAPHQTPIYTIAHTRKDNGPWRPGTETAHNEYFLINFCLPYKLLKNIKKTES